MSHHVGRVLYVGQSYYHTWFASRALRKLGWKADVLNWDASADNERFYHGEDFRFQYRGSRDFARQLAFYVRALRQYDLFHFSNAHGLQFGNYLGGIARRLGREGAEVGLLKRLGKKIVYSNNGCLDGVSQTSFSKWGDEPVCSMCAWRDVPTVCSDERNLAWGERRNRLTDYQITIGANRADYNDDARVHEVPQFYCLDPDFWSPDIAIPQEFRVAIPTATTKIYHAVGNFNSRTQNGVNLKSTHIYVPLVEQLKHEGHDVELMFFKDVPNREVRYYQAQADVVVDMLTFGWFGANVREAMMLGKPIICYLRPEWIESIRREVPGYVEELPVVSATPATVHSTLTDLIENPRKRAELGRRGRAFALKWHSAEAAGRRLDEIYRSLLRPHSDAPDATWARKGRRDA